MKVALSTQALAVESCAVDKAAWLEVHEAAVAKGKTKPHPYLEMQRAAIPELKAAAATLRWLAQNEERFRAFLSESPS